MPRYEQLKLLPSELAEAELLTATGAATRLIEDAAFPFETVSAIAEAESWRKEISRPIYHMHKWWAQRLGSVFRALMVASAVPAGEDLRTLFFKPVRLPELTVFDPFMGSGTTVGEGLKLGARVIGRDINPVAHFTAKTALNLPPQDTLLEAYRALEARIAHRLLGYYEAKLPGGQIAPVLYYFWVKQLPCPSCGTAVDLFSSYTFAQHAYPRRHPTARTLCPLCGAVDETRFDATNVHCSNCGADYNPSAGPVRGAKATCPACKCSFKMVDSAKTLGSPPAHRLYAKLVLTADGSKVYLPADEHDHELYQKAETALRRRSQPYPQDPMPPGYNTNQAIRYGYTHWFHMFNARQLLGISMLADAILELADLDVREVFLCLLSGVLEFNNLFTSYKGEGTGAVRHLFSHHILKPERTPLEANLWGTPKSSGSFSTLFRRRVLSACEYAERPFELRPRKGRASEKVYGLSRPWNGHRQAELSCGDSARTELPAKSVHLVLTDPPFFDNVHYSELADFFYVWQRHWLGAHERSAVATTRSPAEVQHTDVGEFVDRLSGVWRECCRVLRDEGLLVFTYHHSRSDGWLAVLESLSSAGFTVVQVHPVKSEMAVATPKQQSRAPINYDMVMVCRKAATMRLTGQPQAERVAKEALRKAAAQVDRLSRQGLVTGPGDLRALCKAHVVAELSQWLPSPAISAAFEAAAASLSAEAAAATV
jgi:putative DNA methylase